jgi:hypothetical protein
MVFCTSSRSSSSPTSLSILLFVSARMLNFYGHASLLAVNCGLFLSSTSVPLAVAAALVQLTTYGAFNPCNPTILLILALLQPPPHMSSHEGSPNGLLARLIPQKTHMRALATSSGAT